MKVDIQIPEKIGLQLQREWRDVPRRMSDDDQFRSPDSLRMQQPSWSTEGLRCRPWQTVDRRKVDQALRL